MTVGSTGLYSATFWVQSHVYLPASIYNIGVTKTGFNTLGRANLQMFRFADSGVMLYCVIEDGNTVADTTALALGLSDPKEGTSGCTAPSRLQRPGDLVQRSFPARYLNPSLFFSLSSILPIIASISSGMHV